ncbi:hypothetical protein R3P38DRAFT_3206281 [Favolaschia claudopus]|uniref:Uncharacterized protein n=1 Tax=Favolaschia claudopus TaxID=2862362 RepID=A0AAW0AMA0_9AGAR
MNSESLTITEKENLPVPSRIFGRNLPDFVQTVGDYVQIGPKTLVDELADITFKLGIVGSVVQTYEKEFESAKALLAAAESAAETARLRVLYFDQLKEDARKKLSDARLQAAVLRLVKREKAEANEEDEMTPEPVFKGQIASDEDLMVKLD